MRSILNQYKHANVCLRDLNYFKVPVTCFENNVEGMRKFNEVYHYVKTINGINDMIRTPSGGVSCSFKNKRINLNSYSIRERSNHAGIELFVYHDMKAWRFQWRQTIDHTGRINFLTFCKICKKHGIMLEDYGTQFGEDVKKQIVPAPIKLEHQIYRNHWWKSGDIHHIDINSSYPAGILDAYPEFKPVIEEIYKMRKRDPKFKNILNHSIGFMQSKFVGYKYAKLAKAAIDYNNRRIGEIANLIRKYKGIILLYNTDGIWYKGKIFNSPDRGTKLGQWKYDYIYVKQFHIKSEGCYEFLDRFGHYESRARGVQKSLLTKMGDIDTVKGIRKFWLDKEKGIVYEN